MKTRKINPAKGLFGRYFRSSRKKLGLTQLEFARKLGISQSCLSKIESGILRNPGAMEYVRIQRMLRAKVLTPQSRVNGEGKCSIQKD